MVAGSSIRQRWLLPLLVVAVACESEGDLSGPVLGSKPPEAVVPLRDLAEARGMRIGSAVDAGFDAAGPEGTRFRERLATEFDVLTPERDLVHALVHPARDTYAFARADSMVEFAEGHGMAVRGHGLVSPGPLASWLTEGGWSPAEAETLMREHVAAVVTHYRGRVTAWDVVDRALDDDGTLRSTFWSDHMGRDYIEMAFREAHQADPDARLFYSDDGIAGRTAKADSVYALLVYLLARGTPLDGIGVRAHFEVGTLPSRSELTATFQRFADLGLTVHLSALDVRLPLPPTDAALAQQGLDYRRVVEACRDTPACEVVVTWGFTDAYSWVPAAFEGFGAALLLDEDYVRKPAYWGVHDALAGR